MHYQRWRKSGDPMVIPPRRVRAKRDLAERLWEKIDATGICWEWTAFKNPGGYGMFGVGGGARLAHRVVWELLVGSIPEGLGLDHLCRVRHCVNPDHLEPVTTQINVLRGIGPAAVHAAKTHCSAGHELNEANTYHPPRKKHCRACRICRRIYNRRRKAKMREQRRG
jgi:hypothetical protein